jgi:excisionase family DNA binding protein
VPAERRIFLTIAESAELSGLPVRFLRRLMRDGTLKAIRVGTGWRIPRTELESLSEKLAVAQAPDTRQQLSEAEERDLEMNRLRRQGLLPIPQAIPEVN